jgi:16S rRNA (guanine(966)-N(2))-methyltransferase RsmD
VREAVFSVLGPTVRHATALDLFAGSGAYGLEALSRGALFVQFVDHEKNVSENLTRVIKTFGVRDKAEVRRKDAAQALRDFAEAHVSFDLVFLDAPYEGSALARVLFDPFFTAVLREGAVVVVERRALRVDPIEPERLTRFFARKYGETMIEIFSYEEGLPR